VIAWVILARGALALMLGFSLILQLEGTLRSVVTFMGVYWVISGVLMLAFHRQVRAAGARRLPVVAGIVSIVAGVAVLARIWGPGTVVSAQDAFLLLGLFILATGVTNAASGVRTGTGLSRERSRESVILGVLEIVLGVIVILARGEQGSFLIAAATGWAFAAGFLLIAQGMRMRRALGVPEPPAGES
jgi:uncharacterized membrane protein HdeD (DUF308 family)